MKRLLLVLFLSMFLTHVGSVTFPEVDDDDDGKPDLNEPKIILSCGTLIGKGQIGVVPLGSSTMYLVTIVCQPNKSI